MEGQQSDKLLTIVRFNYRVRPISLVVEQLVYIHHVRVRFLHWVLGLYNLVGKIHPL